MGRKMISVDEDTYRELVKAKGKIEMGSGQDLTLGDAVLAIAAGFMLGYAAAQVIDEIDKLLEEE